MFKYRVRRSILPCYVGLLALMGLTNIPCSAAEGNTTAVDISLASGKVFYLPIGGEKEGWVGLIPIRNTKASGLRVECRQRAQSVEIEVTALDRSADGEPFDVEKAGTLLKWKGTLIGKFKGKLGDILSIPLDKVGLPAMPFKIVPVRRSPLPDGGPFCAVQPAIVAPLPGICMGMGSFAMCCRSQ
jgi:hypothetical protein